MSSMVMDVSAMLVASTTWWRDYCETICCQFGLNLRWVGHLALPPSDGLEDAALLGGRDHGVQAEHLDPTDGGEA